MGKSRVRIPDFQDKKRRGEKLVMLTAYDATMARLLDRADLDALLVGDSLGMVVLGYETDLAGDAGSDDSPHPSRQPGCAPGARGGRHALPYLSGEPGRGGTSRRPIAPRGGAAAVKLEGGRPVLEVVRRLVDVGIPVMGHLGLLPQSVHQLGGYGQRGTRPGEVDALVDDAGALEQAGAFAVVLEAIPSDVARLVTARVGIPTIGIGAGPHCDGQILVSYDMLGLFDRCIPSFVKQYARLADTVVTATQAYIDDVRAGRYPQAAPGVASAPTTSHAD